MTESKKRQNTKNVQRDYVLHDPKFIHLLGTLENYGRHMALERYNRVESQVNEQREKVRAKALSKNLPDPFEERSVTKERPKSAVSRDYVLHEPNFRSLQETYIKYYDRPVTANQTKAEVRRKKRLSAVIRNKKEELLDLRKANIEELREQLEELEEMDVDEMTSQELMEHNQRVASLKARIQRDMKRVRSDFLPKPIPRVKPIKPEPVLEWNNPPQYDIAEPPLRIVMAVNEIYGEHMDAARKAILASTVEHIRTNKREYDAWKRQM